MNPDPVIYIKELKIQYGLRKGKKRLEFLFAFIKLK